MEMSVSRVTAPSAVFDVGGRRFEIGSLGLAEAMAGAHAAHARPRCLCTAEGVEMYVARLGDGYIVKRMPDTGSNHAPGCPSYEPPADCSGLGQVLGSAIVEDPATGETTLKLDFALTKMPGRSQMPSAGGDSESVATDGTKLSLRGLLHYLWDQAELTRWHPGFAGKRTWATVRRHLLQAAERKIARGDDLRARLYVPEPFTVEERDAIKARRLALWRPAVPSPGKPQHLMLLIGEIKEIEPARHGFRAFVKHVPDQAFAIDEQLYRRLMRRFSEELALWGASDDIHLVMIATFGIGRTGVPVIHELCLMPATRQWLPVKDGFDQQLVERLVDQQRAFVKGLHYNLGPGERVANATLIDCDGPATMLFVQVSEFEESAERFDTNGMRGPAWVWRCLSEVMPPLPSQRCGPSLH
jgi:hypothetical protein